MDHTEALVQLNKFIDDIDRFKKTGNPKANDFVKWVRDVKQHIEQTLGPDHNILREFKKINYYPTKVILFGGEAAAKEAYVTGLSVAKDLLLSYKKELEDPSQQSVVAPPPPAHKPEPEPMPAPKPQAPPPPVKAEEKPPVKQPEAHEEDDLVQYPEFNGDSFEQQSEEKLIPKKTPPEPVNDVEFNGQTQEEIAQITPLIKKINKKEESPMVEPIKKVQRMDKKVLLIGRDGEPLTESLATFISNIGYELVLFDTEHEHDLFNSNALKEAVADNTAYSIVFWKAESQCDEKSIPSIQTLLATAYLIAKRPPKRVLVLHWPDIDPQDPNFAGFNLVAVDKIPELMDLKIAREMDAAGLNIDFNVFKRL